MACAHRDRDAKKISTYHCQSYAQPPRPDRGWLLRSSARRAGSIPSAQTHGESGAETRRQGWVAVDLYSRRLPLWLDDGARGGRIDNRAGEGAIRAPHRSSLWRVCQGDHGTALAATRKRHAHILANEQGISIQNGGQNAIQNEAAEGEVAIA
jgi:hypothetical protein